MKYDELTNRYAKWLFPLIDRRNCGFLHADDRPRHFHTDRFLASRDLDYPPRQITRTDLAGHLFGADTLYYHSWHESGYVLAMIDIDAKKRQTDAQSVADWLITTYLPNAYCEPSTRGKGRHVYALFRVGNERPWDVNAALARAGCALKVLAAYQGFGANIDNIFGTFTLWSKDEHGRAVIEDRGLLGKVPRLPRGLFSLAQLTSAPVFRPSALSAIIEDADKLRTPSSSSSSCTKVSTSESPIRGDELLPLVLSPCTKASTSESSQNTKLNELKERTASKTNPMARMRFASSLFYHQHGRYAADEHELVVFYEANGLNTDEDRHGRRQERARIALAQHRLTEKRPTTRRYLESDYLPMINHNVTEAVRRHSAIKYPYKVSDDILAVSLYAYTTAAFAANRSDRMHSLSDLGLVAMLKTLAAVGDVKSKFHDKEKRVAVRQMLQLAGLIVLRDGEHVYGGREHGVGDKWGIGPNHVRFIEFEAAFGHVADPRGLSPIRAGREAA